MSFDKRHPGGRHFQSERNRKDGDFDRAGKFIFGATATIFTFIMLAGIAMLALFIWLMVLGIQWLSGQV